MAEERIIILKELMERVEKKELKIEDILTLALKCVNCRHRDLLKNFLAKRGEEKSKTYPYPYQPYQPPPKPYQPTPYKKWYCENKKKQYTKNKIINLMIQAEIYLDDLFCPKCKSRLIVLDKEFIKNNVLKML